MLLGGVVLDDQQPLARAAAVKSLMRSNAASRPSVVARLDQERERAVLEAVLALLLDRDDLHRDVARRRIVLELVEHRPAEHVGQEDVERDRGRLVLARERQRLRAALGDQHLEAVVARQARAARGVVRIVLDDQQHAVAGLDRRRDRPAMLLERAAPAARSAGSASAAARSSGRGAAALAVGGARCSRAAGTA